MALRQMAQAVLILRPKQPMLDWLASLPGREREVPIEKLRGKAVAVLVPALESQAQLLELLDRNMDRFFEQALLAWSLDLAAWPKKRDLRSFREMFEMELIPAVFDMGPHIRDTATAQGSS